MSSPPKPNVETRANPTAQRRSQPEGYKISRASVRELHKMVRVVARQRTSCAGRCFTSALPRDTHQHLICHLRPHANDWSEDNAHRVIGGTRSCDWSLSIIAVDWQKQLSTRKSGAISADRPRDAAGGNPDLPSIPVRAPAGSTIDLYDCVITNTQIIARQNHSRFAQRWTAERGQSYSRSWPLLPTVVRCLCGQCQ